MSLTWKTSSTTKKMVSFCTRCFGNSAVPMEDGNFCHNCGSEGTCVSMVSDAADYLRENIKNSIMNSVKHAEYYAPRVGDIKDLFNVELDLYYKGKLFDPWVEYDDNHWVHKCKVDRIEVGDCQVAIHAEEENE